MYKWNPGDEITADKLNNSIIGFFCQEQNTPDMTLRVSAGDIYFGTSLVEYAGGNSPSFTAPDSNDRIDILVIDSSGTLSIVQGEESSNPIPPAVPIDKAPICSVYNRVGESCIKSTDDSNNGYIYKDLRRVIHHVPVPHIEAFTSSGTFTVPPGVKWLDVEIVGGGGGAAHSQTIEVRTGASAGYCRKIIDCSNTSSYSFTVGAGGKGGNYCEDGGDSTFDTMIAGGGGSSGRGGGSASGGDINIPGISAGKNDSVRATTPLGIYGAGGQGDSGNGHDGIVIIRYYR